MIFHDQDTNFIGAARLAACGRGGSLFAGPMSIRKGDDEGGALTQAWTLGADRTAMKFDDDFRDCETEAEPAELARNFRAALLKRVENRTDSLF